MKTIEERLTVVEHKVAENARGIDGLREAIVEGFKAMDRRFEAIELRFDRRFETIDRRFETMDRRFEAVDRRFQAMEQQQSRQFHWLIGTLVATMLSGLSILAAALLGG